MLVLVGPYNFPFRRYEDQLESFCKFMDPLLDSPTPEVSKGVLSFSERLKDKLNRSDFWTRCLKRALSMGQKDMV